MRATTYKVHGGLMSVSLNTALVLTCPLGLGTELVLVISAGTARLFEMKPVCYSTLQTLTLALILTAYCSTKVTGNEGERPH